MRKGQWVVQTRGRYSGRIGRVRDIWDGGATGLTVYIVQLGPDGPFQKFRTSSLRLATLAEIADKQGCSVRSVTGAEEIAS